MSFSKSPRAVLMMAAALAASGNVSAQKYPEKNVRVLVGYTPGSSADFTARIFTTRLSELLGYQFVIDNRSGASGNMAAEAVARAVPDGYTLLTNTVSYGIQQNLRKDLRFDIVKDFEHISIFASTPYVIAVHPAVPAKNLQELIALAKKSPGALTYGSGGPGSGIHLASELLKLHAQIDMLHVPYKGSSLAATDLLAGRLTMLLASQLLQHTRAGKLRGIAITSLNRVSVAPELPTVAESGLPGFEAGSWSGLSAPKGTRRDVVMRLNAAVTQIAGMPDTPKLIQAQSAAEVRPGTAKEAAAYVDNEVAKWKKVITAAKIVAE